MLTAMMKNCYFYLKRNDIPSKCGKINIILNDFEKENHVLPKLLEDVLSDFKNKIRGFDKLPYDLKLDAIKTKKVLNTLYEVLRLDGETYIRNFSTALFKDSKMFQRDFRQVIESILYDYTDDVVEKSRILEYYNLYENPTYVLIKGDVFIYFQNKGSAFVYA